MHPQKQSRQNHQRHTDTCCHGSADKSTKLIKGNAALHHRAHGNDNEQQIHKDLCLSRAKRLCQA